MKLTKGGDVEMPALIFDEEQVKQVIDRVVERTFQMHYSWDWPGGVAFYGAVSYTHLRAHET
ncbi:hypothetical protein JDS79_36285, partial [Bacillus cereus]|nr:hypothetical protein [Bacillus cereus]